MATLPLIRDTTPGIYHVCAAANTDYVIAIPATARGCVIWFETSAANAAYIRGRIGMDEADTAVTGITGTDTVLGYQPPMPVEYALDVRRSGSGVWERDAFLHVACATAGAVVRGMWLYNRD